jgi:hypothetical protein
MAHDASSAGRSVAKQGEAIGHDAAHDGSSIGHSIGKGSGKIEHDIAHAL